jgi:diguanylate cyclase (GGDEF)-like protein
MGKPLSQLPWLVPEKSPQPTPWEAAMQNRANASGVLLPITQPDQSVIKVIVNASPILDAHAKLRGCMVTFYDVTELHRANETMSQAMVALEASREQVEKQNEELMRLATRDSLTGCLNRRAFFSAAEPLFAKLRLEARSVTCIMCDIDHFKVVNDTYGHATGDQVIVAVANCLGRHMRAGDLLCRYGGEEFCILLSGTTEDAALDVAERLRHEIEHEVGAGIRSVEGLHITSSFGVVGMRSGAEHLSELIELADFALYTSKRTGRNRVTLWDESLGNTHSAGSQASALPEKRPTSSGA